MKSSKSYLHSLLDALVGRVIQTGESREQIYVIPYHELADDYKHYNVPEDAAKMDVHVHIIVKLGDEDESYDTGENFTIENKIRH